MLHLIGGIIQREVIQRKTRKRQEDRETFISFLCWTWCSMWDVLCVSLMLLLVFYFFISKGIKVFCSCSSPSCSTSKSFDVCKSLMMFNDQKRQREGDLTAKILQMLSFEQKCLKVHHTSRSQFILFDEEAHAAICYIFLSIVSKLWGEKYKREEPQLKQGKTGSKREAVLHLTQIPC